MQRQPVHRSNRLLTFATIVLVVASLYFAQDVLIPLTFAVLISFLLAPLVKRLERLGLPRVVSVIFVTLSVTATVVAFGYLVTEQALDLAKNLDQYKQNITAKIERLRPSDGNVINTVTQFGEEVDKQFSGPSSTQAATTAAANNTPTVSDPPTERKPPKDDSADRLRNGPQAQPDKDGVQPVPVTVVNSNSGLLTRAGGVLGAVVGPLGTTGLVAVFTFFILLEREDLRDRMLKLVGFGQLNVTTKAIDDAAKRISRYLIAQAFVNGTYGIAISTGLWIIGRTLGDKPFPNVLLWGLLCAVLRFIPYIGPWIAAAFPLAVAFATYSGFSVFVAVGLLFVTIELLSNNLMEPWLYGSSTGMTTIAVLVSAVFWTWLWGAEGLVLATPLTVCIVVLGKYVPNLKFFDIALGDDPVFSPSERVYQRLLSLDAEEASDIVEEQLEKKSIEEVFDTVLLNALAMAEEDRRRGMIDEERMQFIRDSIREIVDECADEETVKLARGQSKDWLQSAMGREHVAPVRQILPKDCVINVFIMPTHNESDEVAGLMLAQLLRLRGYYVTDLPSGTLAGEVLQRIEREEPDIVCISAMPSTAVTHARYHWKRLYARFPEMPTVIGFWGFKGNLEKARERMGSVGQVPIETTLGKALEDVEQRAHPFIVKQAKPKEPAETR